MLAAQCAKNSLHWRKLGGAADDPILPFQHLEASKTWSRKCDDESMSPISSLSSNFLQSILNPSQSSGSTRNSQSSTGASSVTAQPENGQLSPFAQLMSTLQQLQQSNPTEYKQVTQQIATNLQNAAKTAQADGNSTQATQLNQLATDFTSASQSGQMPNVQDLAQAVGGHRHHHHAHAASTDTDNTLSQQLSAFQANSTPNESLDPMAIIANTLSSAGISTSANS